jgi:hypothetical protein
MKRLSDDKMLEIIDKAWEEYKGDVTVLNSAIGALVMGRHVGWQGVRVMYARVTYTRYEKILGIKFRDVLPERGKDAERLRGIRIIDGIGKFWQAISSGLVSAKEAAQTA